MSQSFTSFFFATTFFSKIEGRKIAMGEEFEAIEKERERDEIKCNRSDSFLKNERKEH